MIVRNGNSEDWRAECENRVKRLTVALRSGNRAMAGHEARELRAAAEILEEELVFESHLAQKTRKVNANSSESGI